MRKFKEKSIFHLAEEMIFFLGLVCIFSAILLYTYEISLPGITGSIAVSLLLFFTVKKYLAKNDATGGKSLEAKGAGETGSGTRDIGTGAGLPHSAGALKTKVNCPNGIRRLFMQAGRIDFPAAALTAGYLVLFLLEILLLYSARTDRAIVSPWEAIDGRFFLLYFLSTLALIGIISAGAARRYNPAVTLLVVAHFFTAFSVALIVYVIGYGYDPFVHQATVEIISQQGFIEPRPLYYLGQYGLFTSLHALLRVPIAAIDKLAVPVLACLLLVPAAWGNLRFFLKGTKAASSLAILFSLILPFSIFIVTTPQNLAYFFLLAMIMQSLNVKTKKDFIFPLVYGLAAASIHPIAGIPAILYLAMIWLHGFYRSKILLGAVSVLLVFAMPVLFVLSSPGSELKFSWENFSAFLQWLNFAAPSGQGVFLNLAYLYGFNVSWIIIALIMGGFMVYKKSPGMENLAVNLAAGASLFFSYFLTLAVPFDYLIDYEKDNFAERLLVLAIIFLLPFMLMALLRLVEAILSENIIVRLAWFVFFSALITASLYCSYPRKDNFFNSRGYSTGKNDIEAVRWINDNAVQDFIVLADQQVSAAALNEYGFKKYYARNGCRENDLSCNNKFIAQIFYYPVPTGGPLYGYYLDMVYDYPSRETMQKAMDLAGVKEGYFVLNKYWWAFPKILDEAKLEASSWQKFGDGEVYVFKY